ncbi:hypothetical protein M422DRAFT_238464 [Sphaerobolus stellatus SS14]|nr:hypothetical protein M422DRAFT_238464 [Sphaerobolus stellatus SS14]
MPTPAPNEKLALPAFLKILTAAGLPTSKAIAVAGKIYKTHNTPHALGGLTDGLLTSLQVNDKEDRRLVLAAVKKSGFRTQNPLADPATAAAASAEAITKASSSTKKTTPKKRKREDVNEYLPEAPRDEAAKYGSFKFKELLDEQSLMSKSVMVNRAPVMTAWATVVAEALGFKREEALSIASVYTEMNATSKGVGLGIFEEGKGKGLEATAGGGQPFVEFMGRNPVFSTRDSQWRGLLKGEPVSPSAAYKYITNAFHQTTGHVIGAMRLLAETYPPRELNRLGFSLYADFRPTVDGWGKKGELKCSNILAARRSTTKDKEREGSDTGRYVIQSDTAEGERDAKKVKSGMSLEEYEAALDEHEQEYGSLFSDPEG